jgi:cell division transport system permease protein
MSSNLEAFWRIVRLGVVNFWRNRWLTLGATLLMSLTLIMISVSLLMTFLLHDAANSINSRIDLTIYFRDDTVPDQSIINLADKIKNLTSVSTVHFVDKAEALQIWNRLPLNEDIKAPVTSNNNPLPRSIEVTTSDPNAIASTANAITKLDNGQLICDECVSYSQNKDTVNRILAATKFVQKAGIVLSIFFGVIAIFNVLNIIRITITARSDEIEIMRFVGASNAFVRGPFIVEGILYGLLGTIVSTGSLLILAWIGSEYLGGSGSVSFLTILNVNIFHYLLQHLTVLVLSQVLIGVLVGVFISTISIRRYLRL